MFSKLIRLRKFYGHYFVNSPSFGGWMFLETGIGYVCNIFGYGFVIQCKNHKNLIHKHGSYNLICLAHWERLSSKTIQEFRDIENNRIKKERNLSL